MNAYRHTIKIEGSRGTNVPRLYVSTSAEFMDGGLNDPLEESSVVASIRRMTFIVKTRDFGKGVPQIGDIVTTPDGKRFSVYAVQPFYNRELILDCRSC